MEVYVTMVLAGLYAALIFVLLGVIVGEAHVYVNKKRDKGNNGSVRKTDTDMRIYHRGDYHKFDCFVGNVHGKKSRGCNSGSSCYRDGKITEECTVNALREVRREMRTMLSETEKDALEYSADLIETMIEFMPTFQDICNADWRIQSLIGVSTAELERAIMQGDLRVITREEHEKMHKGI